MNLICVLYFLINTSLISGYQNYPVPGVEGLVKSIQYDSEFNIYVTTIFNSSTILSKINSKKKIVMQEKRLKNIQNILISTSDNVYIFVKYESQEDSEAIILLKPDSASLIYTYSLRDPTISILHESVQLIDSADNIYFNTGMGVGLLKANETIPRAIINLEYFWIKNDALCAVTSTGDVILGGFNSKDSHLIAIIPTHQQTSNAPAAHIFKPLNPNLVDGAELTAIKAHPTGIVAVGISGYQARLLNAYDLRVELSQYNHDYINFHSDPYSLYFFSVNLHSRECYLNYVRFYQNSTNWNLKRYPKYFRPDFCYNALTASDNDGNFFFAYGSQIFTLRKKETDVEKITFVNPPSYNISSIMTDENDTLWVIGGDLYQVRKDSTEANKLTDLAVGIQKGLLKMYKNDEVLIGTDDGLYVFSK